ncbi:hypothetical protein SAMD00019534_097420, partial [Acytostelium subglobosum LB1]|uniref:hypothetical protein n=1 Tax=Acytostelium subglobosum LB1 TaxID=1410327 RepID=UPI000644A868
YSTNIFQSNNINIMELTQFLEQSDQSVAKLVSSTGSKKSVVYAFDGTRRSYLMEHGLNSNSNPHDDNVRIDYDIYSQSAIRKLLDHLLMMFDQGIHTIIYPMWFYTLEQRGPEYLPKFIGYLRGLGELLNNALLLEAYLNSGVRIIFYGDYKQLLMRVNDYKLLNTFETIMELTKHNTKKVVLLGTIIQDPSETIIQLTTEHYCKYNRAPTKKELIKQYYQVEVEEVSFYFGFDRFTTDGRPILLCDNGREDLYFSVSPHSLLTKQQFRKILYDHLYCRSVANAKEYQLKTLDVEIMRSFYLENMGNTMGVGDVQYHGQYWCPLPQVNVHSLNNLMESPSETGEQCSTTTTSVHIHMETGSDGSGSASSPPRQLWRGDSGELCCSITPPMESSRPSSLSPPG